MLDRTATRSTATRGTDSLLAAHAPRGRRRDARDADGGRRPGRISRPAPKPRRRRRRRRPVRSARRTSGVAGATSTPDGRLQEPAPRRRRPPGLDRSRPCKSPEQIAKMPGIVVGRTLAKQLDVGLGDCVQVTSPQIGMSFGARRPRAHREELPRHRRSSRPASISTTRSSSTPISTRRRPSTSTATA